MKGFFLKYYAAAREVKCTAHVSFAVRLKLAIRWHVSFSLQICSGHNIVDPKAAIAKVGLRQEFLILFTHPTLPPWNGGGDMLELPDFCRQNPDNHQTTAKRFFKKTLVPPIPPPQVCCPDPTAAVHAGPLCVQHNSILSSCSYRYQARKRTWAARKAGRSTYQFGKMKAKFPASKACNWERY